MLMAAGYAAVEGGRTLKQTVQRRKNPTLEGDFIVASTDPAQNQRRRNRVQELQTSFTQTTNRLRQSWSKMASTKSISISNSNSNQNGHEEKDCSSSREAYSTGQEVMLHDMEDPSLNGMKALILHDFGSQGILVQFLAQKEGYDNYHESGLRVSSHNIIIIAAKPPPIGAWIELQNLQARTLNGQRGMVVEPSGEGRVVVQLEDGSTDGSGRVSVKFENCRIVESQQQKQQEVDCSHHEQKIHNEDSLET